MNTLVPNKKKRPGPLAYEQVRSGILEMIAREKFHLGDRLPTERELAKKFRLNHQTIRKGLAALVEEGIIERRVGVGTFLRAMPDDVLPGMDRRAANARVRGKETTLVGCLVLASREPYAVEFLGHLHHVAEARGIILDIRTISGIGPKALAAVREMAKDGCLSAVLSTSSDSLFPGDLIRLENESPIPIIFGKKYPGLEAYCFENPDIFGQPTYNAMEMSCRYFTALGYKTLMFLGPDGMDGIACAPKLVAFNRYLFQNNLTGRVALVRDTWKDIDRAIEQWRPLTGKLAVICHDDDYALRLITGLHKHNLRIPEDVAVLGFNNIPQGQTADPPLSTIQFDYDYVVEGMLNHALAMGRGESDQSRGDVQQQLVIRESCGGRVRAGDKLKDILREVQQNVT